MKNNSGYFVFASIMFQIDFFTITDRLSSYMATSAIDFADFTCSICKLYKTMKINYNFVAFYEKKTMSMFPLSKTTPRH